MEEMGAEMCGDFFDQIDDLLVFPNDDIGGFVLGGEGDGGFEDVLAMSSSTSTGDSLLTELSVPCEDIAHLEWLSNFVEDSFSAGNIIGLDNHSPNNDSTYQTAVSPISVLESSSCSKEFIPLQTLVPSRARSKRPRPASLSPRSVSLLSPTSSETSSISFISPSTKTLPNSDDDEQEEKKKKKKKLRSGLPRKCLHCEIEKTPQWRAGPMGPRTLCNACGVRYMSGRLYPEYRPAASPTFIASEHSCSHKKVMEMRMNGGHKTGFASENIHLIDSV